MYGCEQVCVSVGVIKYFEVPSSLLQSLSFINLRFFHQNLCMYVVECVESSGFGLKTKPDNSSKSTSHKIVNSSIPAYKRRQYYIVCA